MIPEFHPAGVGNVSVNIVPPSASWDYGNVTLRIAGLIDIREADTYLEFLQKMMPAYLQERDAEYMMVFGRAAPNERSLATDVILFVQAYGDQQICRLGYAIQKFMDEQMIAWGWKSSIDEVVW